MTPQSSFYPVLDLLRLHQRRSRFIEHAFETHLSLVEAYVLLELDLDPEATFARLAWLINVEEAAVARSIQRLVKRKLVTCSVNTTDQRRRIYRVTAAGHAELKPFGENSKVFLKQHLASLTIEEIAELQRFFRQICDSLGAAPVVLRAMEHPFEEGIRRMTRALGFVGTSIFGSGYSSTCWQILSLLAYRKSGVTLSQLQEELGIHISTLSQMCTRFERSGWLRKVSSTADGRKKVFELTAKGRRILDKIELDGVALFEKAFEHSSKGLGIRFLQLFHRYLGIANATSGLVLRESVVVERPVTEESRRSARAFLILHLVRLSRYTDVSERLISGDSQTFVMRRGAAILAVAEVQILGEKARGVQFIWSEAAEDLSLLLDFIRMIGACLAQELSVNVFQIESKALFPGMESVLMKGDFIEVCDFSIDHHEP